MKSSPFKRNRREPDPSPSKYLQLKSDNLQQQRQQQQPQSQPQPQQQQHYSPPQQKQSLQQQVGINDEWTHTIRPRHKLSIGDNISDHKERQRWSTWTADTSITALESGYDDPFTRHSRKDSNDDAATLFDKSHRESSPSPSLTSPEDALNAALASMLSTANSLLISTMNARSDLARLQVMESALDAELDRREEAVLMEIRNNEKMMEWMEQASKKLDKVLAESSRRPSSSTSTYIPLGTGSGSSDAMARHWRAPSTSQVNIQDASSSLGIFEAKDESATISKSAAKRLEKVLRRASSSGNSPAHSRAGSHIPDLDNAATPFRPTAQSALSSLQLRLGMPAAVTPSGNMTPAASIADATLSLSPSSEPSEYRQRTPSITSESGPSSVMSSSRGEEEEEEDVVEVAQVVADIDTLDISSLSRAFLTPPTRCEDLPVLDDESKSHRRNASYLRSPNPAMMSRHTSHGSTSVSEAGLGHLNFDESGRASAKSSNSNTAASGVSGGGKGALEALRKLNGGSATGQQAPQSPTPSARWGGSLASWVGMTSNNPV